MAKKLPVLNSRGEYIMVCRTDVMDADGINAGWNDYLFPPQIGWMGIMEARIVSTAGADEIMRCLR